MGSVWEWEAAPLVAVVAVAELAGFAFATGGGGGLAGFGNSFGGALPDPGCTGFAGRGGIAKGNVAGSGSIDMSEFAGFGNIGFAGFGATAGPGDSAEGAFVDSTDNRDFAGLGDAARAGFEGLGSIGIPGAGSIVAGGFAGFGFAGFGNIALSRFADGYGGDGDDDGDGSRVVAGVWKGGARPPLTVPSQKSPAISSSISRFISSLPRFTSSSALTGTINFPPPTFTTFSLSLSLAVSSPPS